MNALSSAPSFEAIVARVEAELVPLCFHLQTCDDDRKYARPVYCVRVPDSLFDTFFNSPNGYRGSYFASPGIGDANNSLLLSRVLAVLEPWALRSVPGYNAEFVRASFLAPSAKAWLAECTMELCTVCEGEWARPNDERIEIQNGRWEQSSEPNARFGRLAPKHAKLRLFGAFLNARGDVFIPARKRDRAHQIYSAGWS